MLLKNQFRLDPLVGFFIFIAIVLIGAGGYIAATGNEVLIVLLIGGIAGVAIACSSKSLLLISIFGGIVISGIAQLYTPGIQLIRWGFACSATLLFLYVIFAFVNNRTTIKDQPLSPIMVWAVSFVALLLISFFANSPNLDSFIVGIKGYFQVWGILFALALIPWNESFVRKLPKFFLYIALIQIPFVLHQYFFLVPLRQGIETVKGLVAIDIVSGTFGGTMDHGAANAALSVFSLLVTSCLIALWKYKQLSTIKFLVLGSLCVFPIFINSTKISFLYILAVMMVLFYKEIVEKPISFLIKLGIVFVLLGVMVASIFRHLPDNVNISTLGELWKYTYNYNVEQTTGRDDMVSRAGAIKIWISPQQPHGPQELFIGYGPGSSRITNSVVGKRITNAIGIDSQIGTTAIAAILWEGGIITLICICGLFWSSIKTCGRLMKYYRDDAFLLSIFNGIQAGLVVFFLSMFHKNFFIFHIGYQTVILSILGFLLYWERTYHSKRLTKNSNQQTSTMMSKITQ